MSLSLTTNFVGTAASGYISAALFENVLFTEGIIHPVTNVKTKMAIPRIDFGALVQADSSTWNASGVMTRDEKYLDPIKLKVNFQYDIYAFETSYESLQMPAGVWNNTAPQTLAQYINTQMMASVNNEAAQAIMHSNWSGATSRTDWSTMAGLLKQVDDDTTTVKLTAGTFSDSNIVAKFQAVYNASNTKTRNQSAFLVSINTQGLYEQAQAGKSVEKYFQGTTGKYPVFLGREVIGLPGIPDNVVLFGVPAKNSPTKNFYFGTDLLNDMNQVRTIDMRETDGTDVLRYKMRFFGCTQIGYGAEIVLMKG